MLPTAPTDRSRIPAFIGFGLGVVALVVSASYSLRQVWRFTIDDAGISYAYAKHIAEGQGAVAVLGGPTIEGYSNPLWVLLLAVCQLLGLDIPSTAKWLGAALFLLGCAGLTAAMTRVAGRTWQQPRPVDLVPALLVAGCAKFIVWMPGGLENALYLSLMAWAIAFEIDELGTPRCFPKASFCLLGLCVTRPEGVMYAALHSAIRCALVLQTLWPRQGQDQTVARRLKAPVALRPVWQLFAIVGGGYSAFMLLRRYVFGQWVPNTYFAKVSVSEASLQQGWEYLLDKLQVAEIHWLLPIAFFGLFYRAAAGALLGVYLLGATFFVVYSGGDWMPHGRFVAYGVPLVAIAAGFGLLLGARLLEQLASASQRLRGWIRVASAVFALALLGLWGKVNHPRLTKIARANKCHFCSRRSDFSRLQELQARLKLPSATLLTQDFGAPSWGSSPSLYPIDFLGLCDHTLARVTPYRANEQYFDSERIRFRYAFHEQGYMPTFLYVPRNFWKPLRSSLEFRQGYYSLPVGLLGKHANRRAPLAVSRGSFIDFFPPVNKFAAKPVGSWMHWGTVGATAAGQSAQSGQALEVVVYLSLREGARALASSRVTLHIASDAGAELASISQPFFPRSGLARQWMPGEVRALRFRLPPPAAVSTARLQLRVRRHKQDFALDLGRLADAERARIERRFVPFPSAMPGASSKELGALMARLAVVLERRFGHLGQTHTDPKLALELRDYGDRHAAQDRAEAYLAYVAATQADRRLLGALSDVIWQLRPAGFDHDLATELALLRGFYQRGDAASFERLLDFYLASGRLAKARYFKQLKPDHLDSALLSHPLSRRPSTLARSLPGVESDFDAKQTPGWTFSGKAFDGAPFHPNSQSQPVLAGYRGSGVLSSWSAKRRRGSGTATSAPFVLEGSLLSFLLAGSKKSKAELLVDGQPVQTHKGSGRSSFSAVMWPIEPWEGREAQLRLSDLSRKKKHHVAIDHIRLWK